MPTEKWKWAPEGAEIIWITCQDMEAMDYPQVPVWKLGRTYYLFGVKSTSLRKLIAEVQKPCLVAGQWYRRIYWSMLDCCWSPMLEGLPRLQEYQGYWKLGDFDDPLHSKGPRVEALMNRWAVRKRKEIVKQIKALQKLDRMVQRGARYRWKRVAPVLQNPYLPVLIAV